MEEEKPASLTILIDADKNRAFDELCASQDITASQVIRQLIRDYMVRHGIDDPSVRNDGPEAGAA